MNDQLINVFYLRFLYPTGAYPRADVRYPSASSGNMTHKMDDAPIICGIERQLKFHSFINHRLIVLHLKLILFAFFYTRKSFDFWHKIFSHSFTHEYHWITIFLLYYLFLIHNHNALRKVYCWTNNVSEVLKFSRTKKKKRIDLVLLFISVSVDAKLYLQSEM